MEEGEEGGAEVGRSHVRRPTDFSGSLLSPAGIHFDFRLRWIAMEGVGRLRVVSCKKEVPQEGGVGVVEVGGV